MTQFRLIGGTINQYLPEDGWENVHLDIANRQIWHQGLSILVQPDLIADIAELQLPDESFDEIRYHHVMEHLPRERADMALAEAFRVLKIGGVLDIEVPDFDAVVRRWLDGDLDHDSAMQWVYGEHLSNHESGDSHRYGWTSALLSEALDASGFALVEPIDAGLAVRFRATKLAGWTAE